MVLSFTAISASLGGGNETDHQALLHIKSMITQDPYGALTSWNNSLHFCDWTGVTCGKRHRRVTRIQLQKQGLEGYLSSHVGNLSFLRGLYLSINNFQGAIPPELGRLSRLRVLALDLNKFTGIIPTNISRCSNLEVLALSRNKIVGSIPKEISFLSQLTFCSLGDNKLTGGIPPFLGNITSIEVFSAVRNPLGGSIPDTLGHWNSLNNFYCGSCNLSRTIPHSLFNLSLLTNFSLNDNQLTGSLPSTIVLPRLEFLQLWGNKLTGPIPSSISNCSRLRGLEMNKNKFHGKLEIDFEKVKDIYVIRLGNNNFGSNEVGEMRFIDSLKNCTKLEELDLDECMFQGELPRSIGNLSDKLSYLSLTENKLQGSIPQSIGNLVGLTFLSLGGNKFTGNIPQTIGNLQKLTEVYLYGNQLSGPIPDVMGNLSSLLTLSLYSNMLKGHIPSSIGNCTSLLELYLDNNNLDGKIPTQLLQLSSLSKMLDLSNNKLYGALPTEVGDLNMLSILDISNNYLSGLIPSSLGDCASLSTLSLKGNLFRGTIPPTLSSMKGLVELDISLNNLSGKIPQFLERLKYLNLSYNDFEGEVPMLGVFSNASAFIVSGNSRLCGGLVELGLPKCKETNKHKKKLPLFAMVILIAFVLFTTTCLTYVWCKKRKRSQPSLSSTNKRFIKVTYNQLLKATDGFSEANLIGNGGFSSVYKGILDEYDDEFVAVKVLNLKNRGAQRSFMRECEVWRNIRHRNLLKIITSCSSVDFQGNDFKALIYEYMSNGSLHDWLYSSERSLNLLQRISILIDVASALDYIHNQCIPTVVHGDLKPSNVLLDDCIVAHVGDFGLAQFLGTTSYQNSSTMDRGTIGYTAPEYGLGSEMTCSGDVYSFGILLLEVMTGKKPTDDIFIEGLSIHKFASIALSNHVIDVIDASILKVYQDNEIAMQEENSKKIEECMASAIKIGVSCSMDSPLQRMDIKKVVHELWNIHDTLQSIQV
ncbi:hypothetical protein M8C21_025293 [Ambrosia artemisiifolia]|uniref:non-specific serine/threonine protein kinase n=1 Tax=Ambrosia artemisiifolia TaxID=4212 RepID=A0AAD5GAQ8_AMBAR|nr:hypothetical protein M8C21_025293 [Ambrosia artemisiifolia]